MEGKILLAVKIVKIILFVVFLMMIIWGQKQVGYVNLGVILAGLGGLLMLLYSYNKKYR
ncbi:hypothetical protein EDD76_101194 [Kineothrix alysoides]|uniref:Uncharacterized protein n=1 Tax=Kineothrix alysoides TaxID=1469948 RepID=A0A4V2QCP3_9FIRM|nr:hypothetical protein [Kineothrix alysoides]TCL61097.1 hypothetical protein EDD76_101194 [Kineothrix alysoides]